MWQHWSICEPMPVTAEQVVEKFMSSHNMQVLFRIIFFYNDMSY